MPSALITGVTGQDGRYLADLLLTAGYQVIGCSRRTPDEPLGGGVEFHACDVRDADALADLVRRATPDEIYHLAADSSVQGSWADPEGAEHALVEGTRVLLDAARLAPNARIVLAGSSEIFAGARESPQRETTPVAPISPYGRGKAASRALAERQRRDGQHVSVAILYNHESPRRPPRFITRKVTIGVARIALGLDQELRLGNLDARRDWGFAGDYVDALWRMARADSPDDYVIGTGVSRSVRELCAVAFAAAGLDAGTRVVSDPTLVRAVDAASMVADPSRARERLGWAPRTAFETMIGDMVAADLARLRGEA
jgi:GDPmannose 4,6-dehydratase